MKDAELKLVMGAALDAGTARLRFDTEILVRLVERRVLTIDDVHAAVEAELRSIIGLHRAGDRLGLHREAFEEFHALLRAGLAEIGESLPPLPPSPYSD